MVSLPKLTRISILSSYLGKRDGFLEWPGKTRRTTIDSDGTTSTTLINSVPEDFLLCLRSEHLLRPKIVEIIENRF